MPNTLAAILAASFPRGLVTCEPHARVLILEGKVKINGKTAVPNHYFNKFTNQWQFHTDICLAKGEYVVEVFQNTGLPRWQTATHRMMVVV